MVRSLIHYQQGLNWNVGGSIVSEGGIRSDGEITQTMSVNDVNVGSNNPIVLTAAQCANAIVSLNTPSGTPGIFRGLQLPSPANFLAYLPQIQIGQTYEIRLFLNYSTALNTGHPTFFQDANGNTFSAGVGNNTTNTLRSNFIYKRNPVFVRVICRLTSLSAATCFIDSSHIVDPYNAPLGARVFQQTQYAHIINLDSTTPVNQTLTPDMVVNRMIVIAINSDTAVTLNLTLPTANEFLNANAPPVFFTGIGLGAARVSGSGSVTSTVNLSTSGQTQSLSTSGPPVFTSQTQFTVAPTSTTVAQVRRLIYFVANNDGSQYRYLMCNA